MVFNESLAARIRKALSRKQGIGEKKMFGGVGFLLNGNLLVGVWKDSLCVRLGPEEGGDPPLRAAEQLFLAPVTHPPDSQGVLRRHPARVAGYPTSRAAG
jgi:hypothetical protein